MIELDEYYSKDANYIKIIETLNATLLKNFKALGLDFNSLLIYIKYSSTKEHPECFSINGINFSIYITSKSNYYQQFIFQLSHELIHLVITQISNRGGCLNNSVFEDEELYTTAFSLLTPINQFEYNNYKNDQLEEDIDSIEELYQSGYLYAKTHSYEEWIKDFTNWLNIHTNQAK